jgi:transposase
MPLKTYSEQFKRDAVALYESTEGASLKSTAAELGINRNTLKAWVARFSSKPPGRQRRPVGSRGDHRC